MPEITVAWILTWLQVHWLVPAGIGIVAAGVALLFVASRVKGDEDMRRHLIGREGRGGQ